MAVTARNDSGQGRSPEPRFEARLAGGVVLLDVHHMLPTRDPVPRRRVSQTRRLYVHHSGKLGRAGIEGALASARYVVRQRGWHAAAYHLWIPYEPLMHEGQLAVLRLCPDDWHVFHTGGRCNAEGLGIVLQGSTTARPMSHAQIECLEALLPWLRERHRETLDPETWLSWHSEAGRFQGKPKAACPGKHATAWLESYRERSIAARSAVSTVSGVPVSNGPSLPSIASR